MKTSSQYLPRFLVFTLVTQTIAALALLLDVPFVRQISVFLFLTFVPGILLMRLLRFERPSLAESLLFSVGLSIVFLMVFGFLINELGFLGLISEPLSTGPLFVILNIIISLMCVLCFYTNQKDSNNFPSNLKLRNLLFLILPLIATVGVLMTLIYGNNFLLILTYVLIAVIFVSSLLASRSSPNYPIIIFSIGLALLISTALASKYVYGADIALEHGVFRETQAISSLDWEPYSFEQIASKSMLSVTILPTVYSNLMNIDGTLVFKIVYLLFFSLVPLGLYRLYQLRWGRRIAFASVFFFMATYGFYASIIAQGKQMIGELFYVLLFLVIFSETFSYKRNDWIIIMLLVFGLVVSHYSLSYIFMFLIASTVLGLKIIFRDRSFKIKPTLVAFSLCLTFLWYTTLVYGPFEKFVSIIRYSLDNFLSEFLNLASRGESVQRVLGTIESPTILHSLGTYIYGLTTLLILVGFASLLWTWRKDKLHSEFFMVISLNMVLLFSAVIIPRFAGFLEMWRLYHIALIFAAPLFVLGLKSFSTGILKLRKGMNSLNSNHEKLLCLILASIILVPHFMFQNGLVYEIAGDPTPSSIPLSKDKMGSITELIEESDVFSASWLSKYGDITDMFTYSDTVALLYVLQSYSDIDRRMNLLLSNTTEKINYYDTWRYDGVNDFSNISYIYLRQYNVINERTFWDIGNNIQYNFTEIPILNNASSSLSKIYANSASEIYYTIPL